jgi:hypothetical protein
MRTPNSWFPPYKKRKGGPARGQPRGRRHHAGLGSEASIPECREGCGTASCRCRRCDQGRHRSRNIRIRAFPMYLLMQTDISKLAFGLAAAFVLPIIGYVVGIFWFKVVGGSFPKIDRAWATFCLFMPIVFLGMIVKLGFEAVRSVWTESPFFASAAYLAFGLIVPAGLIYIIVRLWRPRQRHQRYPD